MGAPPVAEASDLSEWQRSADDEAAPSARKMPDTATGHCVFSERSKEWGHCEACNASRGNLLKSGNMMDYYVYILSNSHKNVIYTGVTNDLVKRVYEHKNHMDKKSFTSRYNVENLVYYEATNNIEAAIEREKQIKSWNRKKCVG